MTSLIGILILIYFTKDKERRNINKLLFSL